MRNELRKRLKGWMALVLCVGMMFGNSMMVFAGNSSITTHGNKNPEYIPASGDQGTVVGSSSKKKDNGGSDHKHNFEWDITKEPTRTEDGEASYICYGCNHVAAKQPVTRWQWFVKQYRDLFEDAEQDATVIFEADDMPCISDYMLGLNADRSDVTVIIHFIYDGVSCELTIPAGTDFSALQNDTDTFYGYLALAKKLGLAVKVLS